MSQILKETQNNMPIKQRLLYISSETTHPQSKALSIALYEPERDYITEIDPTVNTFEYDSVHEAIIDGWRVVHFPDQRGSDTLDLIGYQFILEKLEDYGA